MPPPVHGASLMNQYLASSNRIAERYAVTIINLDFVDKVSQIGSFSFVKLFKMFQVLWKLIWILIRNRYELVYFTLSPVGGAFFRDTLFVVVLKVFNNNILYHLHGKGISNNLDSFFKKTLYRFVFNHTSVICLSKLLVHDIKNVHQGKIFIVPNGIPEYKNKGNPNKKHRNILYLSALKKSKGIMDLVKALDILQKRGVSFEAKIVGGDTNDLTVLELKGILLMKGLEKNVSVLGPKYGDEKWEMFSSCGIFVFPTYYANECFPLSILEAMMMGLVPISTTNGAIPEIITSGRNGFTINERDVEGLADCLEDLLQDDEKIRQMASEAQHSFKENYTIKSFEMNMLKVFNELIKQ